MTRGFCGCCFLPGTVSHRLNDKSSLWACEACSALAHLRCAFDDKTLLKFEKTKIPRFVCDVCRTMRRRVSQGAPLIDPECVLCHRADVITPMRLANDSVGDLPTAGVHVLCGEAALSELSQSAYSLIKGYKFGSGFAAADGATCALCRKPGKTLACSCGARFHPMCAKLAPSDVVDGECVSHGRITPLRSSEGAYDRLPALTDDDAFARGVDDTPEIGLRINKQDAPMLIQLPSTPVSSVPVPSSSTKRKLPCQRAPKNKRVKVAPGGSLRSPEYDGQPLEARTDVDFQLFRDSCAVCSDGRWAEGNEILMCDGCDVAIHRTCLPSGRLLDAVPEGDWFCQYCDALGKSTSKSKKKTAKPLCVFCPNEGGAVVPVLEHESPAMRHHGGWAHHMCAIWVPGCTLDASDAVDDFDAVDPARFSLRCDLCGTKEGACLQCDTPGCYAAYHVSCAFASKLVFEIQEDPADGSLVQRTFCATHSPEANPSLSPDERKLPHKAVPWRLENKARARATLAPRRKKPFVVAPPSAKRVAKRLEATEDDAEDACDCDVRDLVPSPKTAFELFYDHVATKIPNANAREIAYVARKNWTSTLSEADKETFAELASRGLEERKLLIKSLQMSQTKDDTRDQPSFDLLAKCRRATRAALEAACAVSSTPSSGREGDVVSSAKTATRPSSLGSARTFVHRGADAAAPTFREASQVWPLTNAYFRLVTPGFAERVLTGAASEPLNPAAIDPVLTPPTLGDFGKQDTWLSVVLQAHGSNSRANRRRAKRVVREMFLDPQPRWERGLGFTTCYTGRTLDWLDLAEVERAKGARFASPLDLAYCTSLERSTFCSQQAYVRALSSANQRLIIVDGSDGVAHAICHVVVLHFFSGLGADPEGDGTDEVPIPIVYIPFVRATTLKRLLGAIELAARVAPTGIDALVVQVPNEAKKTFELVFNSAEKTLMRAHEYASSKNKEANKRENATTYKMRVPPDAAISVHDLFVRHGVLARLDALKDVALNKSGELRVRLSDEEGAIETSFAMETTTTTTNATSDDERYDQGEEWFARETYFSATFVDETEGLASLGTYASDEVYPVRYEALRDVLAARDSSTHSGYADLAVCGVLPPSVCDAPNQASKFERARRLCDAIDAENLATATAYDEARRSGRLESELAKSPAKYSLKAYPESLSAVSQLQLEACAATTVVPAFPTDDESEGPVNTIEERLNALRADLSRLRANNARRKEKLVSSVRSTPSSTADDAFFAKREAEYTLIAARYMQEKLDARKQLERDMSALCGVCGGAESEYQNVMIICERCERGFHQRCYGVDEIPSGDWFCDDCEEGSKGAARRGEAATAASLFSPSKPTRLEADPALEDVCATAQLLLEHVRTMESSKPFWSPNSESAYLDAVDQPLDFTVIQSKLSSKLYGTLDAFVKDVDLLVKNELPFSRSETASRFKEEFQALLKAAAE